MARGLDIETLDPVGSEPWIALALRPLYSTPGVPKAGFEASVGKDSTVAALRQALCRRLDVLEEQVSLVYAGEDLRDDLTLRDNGVVVPGPAARRSGVRVELGFTVGIGAAPGRAGLASEARAAEAVEELGLNTEAAEEGGGVGLGDPAPDPPVPAATAPVPPPAPPAPPAVVGAEEAAPAAGTEGSAVPAAGTAAEAAAPVSHEEFLREFSQTGGWPIAPPETEVGEIRQLTQVQLRALRHVRTMCQRQHMEALPQAIARAERLGFSEFDFVRTLEWVREQAPLIIHVNLGRYLTALSQDTHYRNQFETQASGGRLDNGYRRQVENELFGNAYDGAEPFERVKYGVLNFRNSARGVGSCHYYGEDYFVLKGVRLRTTLSSADTFATRTLATPDYYAHIFNRYSESEFVAALRLGCRETTSISENGEKGEGTFGGHYKEAQYHGEVCLARHVAAIVLHPKHRAKGGAFEQQLRALALVCGGCRVLWMDNELDMDQARAIPKSLRELSYERQNDGAGAASGQHPAVAELGVLQRLRDAMLRREPSRLLTDSVAEDKSTGCMTEAEVAALVTPHLPDLGRAAHGSEGRPVLSLMASCCREGLPDYPAAERQQLAQCLRFVLTMVRDGERSGTLPQVRIRSICLRLADAFEACQAAQARVIEALAGELRNGPPLQREVRAMNAELLEQTVDRMVLHLHSEAAREDLEPQRQLAHLANEYRRLLRMTSIDHASADRHAANGSGEIVAASALHGENEVVDLFTRMCNPEDLVQAFVADVNQPNGSLLRRIDRDGLSRWAGEREGIGRRIYYDESKACLYNGKPEPGDEMQPFLHSQVAAEILCELLDPTPGEAFTLKPLHVEKEDVLVARDGVDGRPEVDGQDDETAAKTVFCCLFKR